MADVLIERISVRYALIASTMLASGWFSPAAAQSNDYNAAPGRYTLDANGVNLADGTQWEVDKDVSIGSGKGELAQYSSRGPFTNASSYNLDVTAVGSKWSALIFGSNGAISETFTRLGSTYTSVKQDGSTLIFSGTAYILTLADGTVYTYGNLNLATNDIGYRYARLTQIDHPGAGREQVFWVKTTNCSNIQDACSGGTQITRTRIQAVTNSFGYQLHYTYYSDNADAPNGNKWLQLRIVKALNMAVDTCNPLATSCSYSQTWPSVTYAQALSGSDTVTTVMDSTNRASKYTVGSDVTGQYFKITPAGATAANVTIRYSGNRVSSFTRDGRTWTYAYSPSGAAMTVSRTDPDNKTLTVVSDMTIGLPTSVTNELNKTTSFTYETAGRLKRTTLPEGDYIEFTYDTRGNVTEERHVSKTPGTPADIVLVSHYSDDPCTNTLICNKPLWTKDGLLHKTDYTYDPVHGGVLTVTAPADNAGTQPQVRYTYSPFQAYYKDTGGSIVASGVTQYELTSTSACMSGTSPGCVGTPQELKSTVSYGAQAAGTANNLLPVIVAAGAGDGSITATSAMTYNAVGDIVSIDGPLDGSGDTTVYHYDAARRPTGMVGPKASSASAYPAQRYDYDGFGLLSQAQIGTVVDQSDTGWNGLSEVSHVSRVNDASGRPTRMMVAAGTTIYQVQDFLYDTVGRLSCTVQYMNLASTPAQATSCVPSQINGPFGPDRVTQNFYDAAGRLTIVQRGVGTSASATNATGYTDNGRIQYVVDGQNNRTGYTYDGFDRLTQTNYPLAMPPGSNATDAGSYEINNYDAANNVSYRRLRDGSTVTLGYDNLNRLMTITPSGGNAVTYQYDLMSHPLQAQRAGDGVTLSFGWNARGQMTSESQPAGSLAYQYDVAGRRMRITWPDAFFVSYNYDITGNVMFIRENGAASGVGVLASYSYDNLGRRSGVSYGNGTARSYAWDPLNRLTGLQIDLAGTAYDLVIGQIGSTGAAIGYNPASQITTLVRSNNIYAWTGSYNVNRPYTTNGLNQYTAAGATAFTYDARGNLITSGASTYGYDTRNELTSAPGVTLAYDPLGRLMRYDTSASMRLGYSGSDLMTEAANPSGTILRRYVPGPGTDEPIVWYEGTGTSDRRFLQADERGSIVAITDGSGNKLAINTYDEYGIPASSNQGRYEYTGQTWYPELGMYNYKARIYSPTLGRFMQTDPIGYGDGPNWYNYAHGDPVNQTDPSGTRCGGTGIESSYCDPDPNYPDADGPAIVANAPGHATLDVPFKLHLGSGFSADRIGADPEFAIIDELLKGYTQRLPDLGQDVPMAETPPQSGQNDPPPCNVAQRGLQALGKFGVELGGEVGTTGLVIGAGGIGIAAVSASTVVLAPGGVLVGGTIAEGGADVAFGGGVIGTGGALLMLAGGSGKAAVSDLAGRVVTHILPKGFGGDLVSNLVGRAVDAIPFEFGVCK